MQHRLLLIVGILSMACPALAQYGGFGYSNPVLRISETPPFTHADIRIMDSILGLTPDQRELTDMLYTEFFDRYREEATEVRLELEAVVEEATIAYKPTLISHTGNKKVAAWESRREEFRSQFVEDLRLLMDQNQIRLWHKVERELRRKDSIGNGRIAGESIDLIRLVDAHIEDWSTDPELVEELDRYAERMDRAIIARDRVVTDEQEEGLHDLMQTDPQAARSLHAEALDLRQRVLRLNTDTLRRLGSHLDKRQHDTLRSAFYDRAIEGRILDSPLAQRIAAARALPSLTNAQREQIAPILQRYDSESLDIKRALFEALSQTQITNAPILFEGEVARLSLDEGVLHRTPQTSQPLLDEAMAKRLERERAAWSAIKPILTREQLIQLPKLDMDMVSFPNLFWSDL
jgi:hypothetical protein